MYTLKQYFYSDSKDHDGKNKNSSIIEHDIKQKLTDKM